MPTKQLPSTHSPHCTYDPASKGGNSPDGRKVKGTLHWVSAVDSIQAEVRLYDRLFRTENPADTDAFEENVNPDSLITLTGCRLEGSLRDAKAGWQGSSSKESGRSKQ